MVIRSRLAVALAAALGAATLFVVSAGPATAYSPGGTGTGGDVIPTNYSDSGSSDDSTVTGQAGGCSIVSTSSYLGASCPSAGLQGRKGIKKIMGSETYHECWDDKMTAAEHQATHYVDTPDTTWYMHRCIKGIDPTTLKITGPIIVTENPVQKHPGDTIVTLGPNEANLIKGFTGDIPFPIAVTSPGGQPRVGGWVSFADGQTVHEVVVNALGVTLRAYEDGITVKPLGAGNGTTLTCPGTGHIAVAGEQPVPGGNCWYRYPRSSAAQPNNQYPVVMSAHWVVTQTVGGVTTQINQFNKSQVTNIAVTEIEAVNVQ